MDCSTVLVLIDLGLEYCETPQINDVADSVDHGFMWLHIRFAMRNTQVTYLFAIFWAASSISCALQSQEDANNSDFRRQCDRSEQCLGTEVCNIVTNICVPPAPAGPDEILASFVCSLSNSTADVGAGYFSWNFNGQEEEFDSGCFLLEAQRGNIRYAFLTTTRSSYNIFFSFDNSAGRGRYSLSDDISVYIQDAQFESLALATSGYIEVTSVSADQIQGRIRGNLVPAFSAGDLCSSNPVACGSVSSNNICNLDEIEPVCRQKCFSDNQSLCLSNEVCVSDVIGATDLCLPYVCASQNCGPGLGCLDDTAYTSRCVPARRFLGTLDVNIGADKQNSQGSANISEEGASWQSTDIQAYLTRIDGSELEYIQIDVPGNDGNELRFYMPTLFC